MEAALGLKRYLSYLVAASAAALFLLQVIRFAHSQAVILDEGLYLYKGFLFMSGRYVPYQDYGPWTNHMPLSFIIPGGVQSIFGLGLRTGRYFATMLAFLLIFGVWILARRLGGAWWGAGAVLAMALNPFYAKLYSHAKAEVLAGGMLIWVLVLVLGEDRRPWQLISGAFLAGLLAMTRINLGPVLPLIIAFVFWGYGLQMGLLAAVAGLTPVLYGHAVYWPGILKLWASQVPREISPFLDPWRIAGGGGGLGLAGPGGLDRLNSFFQGIRFHFVAFLGVLACLFNWPRSEDWTSSGRRKISLLLLSIFVLLLGMHGWAALGKDYCVYCFRVYMAYFSPLGLLLPISISQFWRPRSSRWRIFLTLVFLILLSAGVGFSAFEDLGDGIIGAYISGIGGVEESALTRGLVDGLGLDYSLARRVVPTIAALLASFAIVCLLYIIWRRSNLDERGVGVTTWIWSAAAVLGIVLSPTSVLGAGYREYDCGGDIIGRYEQVGAQLEEQVPPGSLIYWQAESPALLLYMPEVDVFPAQLNREFSLRLAEDEDQLKKLGYWNEDLARSWVRAADFVLVQRSYMAEFRALVPALELREEYRAPKVEACRRGTRISILEHNQ